MAVNTNGKLLRNSFPDIDPDAHYVVRSSHNRSSVYTVGVIKGSAIEEWLKKQKEADNEGKVVKTRTNHMKEVWRWDGLTLMSQYKVWYTREGAEGLIHDFEEMEPKFFNNGVHGWSSPRPRYTFERVTVLA